MEMGRGGGLLAAVGTGVDAAAAVPADVVAARAAASPGSVAWAVATTTPVRTSDALTVFVFRIMGKLEM